MNPLIQSLTEGQLRTDIPSFRPGDTVRVHAKVVEGTRERIQIFEGVVISRKGQGISEMYTVRKISSGIGVERTFPIHTPRVDKIEVVRYGKVRRAKLYYLRALQRLKLYATVKSAVLNFTTCVLCKVKLHVSKKSVNNLQISHKKSVLVADFFISPLS